MYQIPTDSLYKFLALSGMAVFIFSIYYPQKLIDDVQVKYAEYKYKSELLNFEASAHTKKLELHRKSLEKLGEEMDKVHSRQVEILSFLDEFENKKASSEDVEVIKKIEDELNESHAKIDIQDKNLAEQRASYELISEKIIRNKIELDFVNDQLSLMLKQAKELNRVSFFTMLLGAFTSVLGFYLWYYKIQRYNDTIIKNNSDIIRAG